MKGAPGKNEWVYCVRLLAGIFQILCLWTERGHPAQPRNPKCTEKCSTACLLPNTLALILYLNPSQAISATPFTQRLRWRANTVLGHSAPVVQECAGVQAHQRGLWQSPLNSVGLVIKWLDEWAISACQPPVQPGELVSCHAGRTAPYKPKHTHVCNYGRKKESLTTKKAV